MGLSASIPNFTEFHTWMEKVLGTTVFGIHEKKRFFNQKRFCIKDNHLVQVNPLEHMSIETLKSNEFTHIGLYPKEIIDLNSLVEYKIEINEKASDILTLDKLHVMEGDIFNYLKSQDDHTLQKILKINQDSLSTESPTLFKLFKIMRECKDMRLMPMLIFKMESQECMNIYNTLLVMLKEYENLLFPEFNSVNKIIESYFEIFIRESKKLEPDDGRENNIKDLEEKLKDTIFGSESGTKAQLEEFYRNFIKIKIEPDDITRFNNTYGADLTEEYIISMRKKHANREMRMYNNPENLRLRNIYASHPECRMIDTTVSYDEMKKIRRRVNAEITRDTKLKEGLNAPINKIGYGHPFMLGIERGIICYNMLMSPALQRVCQQLINTHPFVTFSDKSLAVGINYPIKTVMLLGSNEEKISNTLAHQACGRAGRRGLDSEGYIIYAGVNIKEILIPKYTIVKKNSVESMEKLITSNISEEFKNYIINEVKPINPEKIWTCDNLIDVDKIAEEIYRLQSGIAPTGRMRLSEAIAKIETIVDDDDETITSNKIIIKSLDEIKAELMLKFKTPTIKVIETNSNNYVSVMIDTKYGDNENNYNIKIETTEGFDSWEDAADADAADADAADTDANNKPNIETSFM
jgi:hypothetical protein